MILGFVWQWLLAIPLKMAHPVSDTPVSLSTYTANIDPASRGSWKTSAWFSESMFAGWPSGKQRCAWRSLPRLNPVNGIHFFQNRFPRISVTKVSLCRLCLHILEVYINSYIIDCHAEVEKDPEAVIHKAVEVLGDLAKHCQISHFSPCPLLERQCCSLLSTCGQLKSSSHCSLFNLGSNFSHSFAI